MALFSQQHYTNIFIHSDYTSNKQEIQIYERKEKNDAISE